MLKKLFKRLKAAWGAFTESASLTESQRDDRIVALFEVVLKVWHIANPSERREIEAEILARLEKFDEKVTRRLYDRFPILFRFKKPIIDDASKSLA